MNRKKKRKVRKMTAGLLAAVMLLGLSGCGKTEGNAGEKKLRKTTVDLMEEIGDKKDDVKGQENGNAAESGSGTENGNAAEGGSTGENGNSENLAGMDLFRRDTADFSVRLLQENLKTGNRNVMVSPVSVLTALAMTANGAAGETQAQMLSVLAPGQSMEALNENWKAFSEGLTNTEEIGLKAANSIWFKDDEEQIRVEEDFLKKNASIYGADIYKAPFDELTLNDINTWVSDKTEGRVTDILNEVPEEAVMYLVNALAFDAEWQEIYKESQVREGEFHISDDETEKATFLYGQESWYLEDENAVGFVKPYKEGYSFVALLPSEGISPEEYAAGLSGEKFLALLEGKKEAIVYTSLPKFKAEYEVEMSDILKALGIVLAFDEEQADFSKLGTSAEGNLFINRVLHKTYIAVDEKGTEAGAATVVEIMLETAVEAPEKEIYEVYLDRPFVYAIVDNATNVPVFIGTVDSIGAQ